MVRHKTTGATQDRCLDAIAAACAELVLAFKALFDPYRPERHYMRGPGPKWHAKHSAAGADWAD
jgi:hypothetical protein